MGRYIERIEATARLLMTTEFFASAQDGNSAWRALLEVFAETEAFEASGRTVDAASVATHFIARKDTMSSVVSCVRAVRENARSLRHLISTEAWVQISEFYRDTEELARKRVALSKLTQNCEAIRTACLAHYGIMEATCYRDEVWLFNRIGAAIERADQMTRLLDMQYFQIDASDDEDEEAPPPPDVVWWNTLLRSAGGYHAFRRRHSFNPRADEAAAFFVFDQDFPRSVASAVFEANSALAELERDYGAKAGAAVTSARRALTEIVGEPQTKLNGRALHRYMDSVQRDLNSLSNALADRYFPVT